MNQITTSLADSYAYARRLCRRSSSSFHLSFRLLPRPQRRAMEVLYAYARLTDDLGDTGDHSLRLQRLRGWREAVDTALRGRASPAPVSTDSVTSGRLPLEIVPALVAECQRYRMPCRYLLEIADGVLEDQTRSTIESFEQLERYCYLVAGTVGLCCTYIWGRLPPAGDPAAEELDRAAVHCGFAFQMTNILRDIGEDAALQRVYLPAQLCRQFGFQPQQIIDRTVDADGFECVVRSLCDRALGAYRDGWSVHDRIDRRGRRMFSLMWSSYRGLLLRIRDDAPSLLKRRITLPLHQRLGLAARHFVRLS